jgi:UV DNA damage repair endonuclease
MGLDEPSGVYDVMTDTPRVGYCCKFISPEGDEARERALNVRGLTMAYLGRQDPAAAFTKLTEIVSHNLEAVRRQIDEVATRPPLERLLRISSDVLPGYTHPTAAPYYADRDLTALIERSLAEAGETARAAAVRLSMHPAQHAILATVGRSLDNAVGDIEYHAQVMAMMGYAGGWHPHGASVNVHGGQRALGAEGVRAGLSRLSAAARDLVTVENDENSFGLDDLLAVAAEVAIVVDLHHHWIKSRGEYLQPDDPRIETVKESWRGVRPLAHVSVSREPLLDGHDPDRLPDFAELLAAGLKPTDLRGHSDMMWNRAMNDLVARHLAWADFEVEAKMKNLASEQLAEHVRAAAV